MKMPVLVMAVILLLIMLGSQLSIGATDSVEQNPKIAHPEQALVLALKITGFAPRMQRVPTAAAANSITEKFEIQDDNTPFLSDSINGKELWRIRLDSVDIRPEQAILKDYDLWERKNFEIEIDPISGHVIRICTVTKETQVPPEPSAEPATEELARSGERYWSFVDSVPDITLLEALNAAPGCMPLVATEIVAQCVLYSEGDQTPRPVWIITSRGIRQVEWGAFNQQTPDESKGRARCVVDATAGVWLHMSNSPHPD